MSQKANNAIVLFDFFGNVLNKLHSQMTMFEFENIEKNYNVIFSKLNIIIPLISSLEKTENN